MFIPIVRRSVTITLREAHRFPFRCDACWLTTYATAVGDGVGVAQMAYLAPDENVARQRARAAAYQNAMGVFLKCPCPRCGAHPAHARAALDAWTKKVASRKVVRRWILIGGLVLSALWAVTMTVAFALSPQGTAPGAVMMALVCLAMGAVPTAIVYGLAGPGARPLLLPYIPQNVVFDPPMTMASHAA